MADRLCTCECDPDGVQCDAYALPGRDACDDCAKQHDWLALLGWDGYAEHEADR